VHVRIDQPRQQVLAADVDVGRRLRELCIGSDVRDDAAGGAEAATHQSTGSDDDAVSEGEICH
jgi:hypothetical protein